MHRQVFFAFALLFLSSMTQSQTTLVYIGNQAAAPEMGIAVAQFDSRTGALSEPKLAVKTPDPAFMALHPSGSHLYLCNTGTPGGVSAFAVERASGALTLLNTQVAEGRGPSHIALDRSGGFVLDANYGGGFIEVFRRETNGQLGERTAFVRHSGRSVHPERQTKAYAHWFGVDPSNRFALAVDLGTDRIVIYRFDANSGALAPHDPPYASVKAGSGPRHLAWHPNGRLAYVIQELTNEIIVFAWDSAKGTLSELQTVATLPAEFSGTNTAAEIEVHPNGKYLYASNRGHDSIASYAIDSRTGRLKLLAHVSSQGKTPRYFAFDPTGRWMIVSNQDSGDLAVFEVDGTSGELRAQKGSRKLGKPMGIVFLP
jgi:6-phosphogluconolactonase